MYCSYSSHATPIPEFRLEFSLSEGQNQSQITAGGYVTVFRDGDIFRFVMKDADLYSLRFG